jgi:hypothetical protein
MRVIQISEGCRRVTLVIRIAVRFALVWAARSLA